MKIKNLILKIFVNTDLQKDILFLRSIDFFEELNISKNTIKSWVRRANISSYNGNKPKSKKLKKEISASRRYEKRIKKLEMELELLRDFIYGYCKKRIDKIK